MTSGDVPKRRVGRFDFIVENNIEFINGSIVYSPRFIPDPKRYDTIEEKGEIFYHDKFTNTRINKKLVDDMIIKITEHEMFDNPPKEDDAKKYLLERRGEIEAKWNEKYRPESINSPLAPALELYRGKDVRIVVLYVDMEGSTRLSSQLSPDENTQIVKIFIMQMCKIIDNYRGSVLKTVGDAVIGVWIAEEHFVTMCDNSIQAAMTMRGVVEDIINPILANMKKPEIGFHIGIDLGTVRVDKVGASDVFVNDDLIGYTMNRAAKIQAFTGHDQVYIGRILFELLHNNWQQYCKKVEMGDKWTLPDPEREGIYPIYEYGGKWDIDLKPEQKTKGSSEPPSQ